MSRNNIKIMTLCLCMGFLANAAPIENLKYTEDMLIIQALIGEESGELSKSRKLYEELYQLTGKKEYLIQEAKGALLQKGNLSHSIDSLVKWITKHPEDRDVSLYRMLVALYIEQGSLVDAENVADEYLAEDTPIEDQMAVAALKIGLNKPEEAVELLKKSYKKSDDERVLLQLVNVLEGDLKKSKEAIALLSNYLNRYNNASIGAYFKLIELYSREKNLEKVAEIYKKLYSKDPQKYFLQKIIEISLYRNDIDGVIFFLEQNKGNEEILFTFYKEKKRFVKAIEIAQKLYKKSKNPKWLAEESMLIYENAKQQSKAVSPHVLKQMGELMEEAIKKGLNDAIYFNYYGYTLIDHDLDIDRGIELVKKALEKEPNNTYYLDSLAWGLYKKGKCDKAYEIMKQVVAQEGLSEEEIKIHWDLIRQCYIKK